MKIDEPQPKPREKSFLGGERTMIESADFYRFGAGWCVPQKFDLIKTTEAPPSAGLFYLVLLPGGWKLAVHRDEDSGGAVSYANFWERDVCDLLRRLWPRVQTGRRFRWKSLLRALNSLPAYEHGFPRGRIARDGHTYKVFHGWDAFASDGSERQQIELIFGVTGNATWIEEEPNNRLHSDQEAIRAALTLAIDVNW